MGNRKKPGEEKDLNAIVTRAGNDIKEMAEILAAFPAPEKWTQKQKAQAVQFAALLDTAQKLIKAKTVAGIDWQKEKETFLCNAGRTKSAHTRTAYQAALDRLEAWAERQKTSLLELTPAQADDFIYALRGERAAASIRLDISGASSFFTWLERRHEGIKNPFRGTKARPPKKTARKIVIPAAEEVEIMIRELPPDLAAAVSIMAYRGLRVGTLPTLSIIGDRFSGHSKGKDLSGKLPAPALDAIKAASLPLRGPFAGKIANTFEKRLAWAIEKLHKAGKIQAGYSAHDFRHFFAVQEYRKDRDIHRVKELLHHASISVTENYLRSLGET
jgi:site-specific recombinase XerC